MLSGSVLNKLIGTRVVVAAGKLAPIGSMGTIKYVFWSGHNLMYLVACDNMSTNIEIINHNVVLPRDKVSELDQ